MKKEFDKTIIVIKVFALVIIINVIRAFYKGTYFDSDFYGMYILEGLLILIALYFYVKSKKEV